MSKRLDHIAWRITQASAALHDWLQDESLRDNVLEIVKARFGNGLVREMVSD